MQQQFTNLEYFYNGGSTQKNEKFEYKNTQLHNLT